MRLIERAVLPAVLAIVMAQAARAQEREQSNEAAREAEYARLVSRVADSAIRRLDFFPARAQTRAQLLLLSPSDTTAAVLHELARRSRDAAQNLDEIALRFESSEVPGDLERLHRELVATLRGARAALDRLAGSATSCEIAPASLSRCQGAFTSASSAVAQAYERYLGVRARIREQILDTRTVLPEFTVASRAAPTS